MSRRRKMSAASKAAAGERLADAKVRSRRQEERLAATLAGRTTMGSGSLGEPGDVKTPTAFISAKSIDQRSIRIDVGHFEEVTRDARAENRTPVIQFELLRVNEETPVDWVLVPLSAVRHVIASDGLGE